MSEKVILSNVNFFESKGAFDAFVEETPIPNNEISLVGAYGLIPTDLDWKQAYTGSVTTINTVICTLPSSWKEVIIKYDWSNDRNADSFFLIPRTALDVTRANVTSDNEIYIRIDSSNQITMTNRGDAGDAMVKGVYYR
jgi:hypothetical protein